MNYVACNVSPDPKTPQLSDAHYSVCAGSTFGASHNLSRAERPRVCTHASYQGSVIGTGMKFGVVVGRFNDLVTKLLLEGALEDFERHGVSRDDVDVVWVPGSFELPVVAKSMAKSGAYDAVVAVGVVVRGATAHYDAVVAGATSGVLGASTDSGVPVIFGVLTCDTMEQALDRAGGKVGNKGGEAAATAIETANVLKQLRAEGKAAGPF
jgi:6,7-dimethyl-8-ribityllumazine synthase